MVFPVKLGSLVCNSMINAYVIGSNFLRFIFGSYHSRRSFHSKGYVVQVLGLKGHPSATPQLEDLWQDCKNEEEVLRRDHSRLIVQQINSLKLKFQIEGIIEDGSYMIEPSWEESNESKSLVVDQNYDEEEDINLRARFILTYTDDWLKKQSKKVFNEPSSGVVSFFEPSTSDIQLLSPITGSVLARGKKKRMPTHIQNMAPRTKSQAKSDALKQHKVQKEKMSTQGQDSNDGLNFSDGVDGDVQFIEAP